MSFSFHFCESELEIGSQNKVKIDKILDTHYNKLIESIYLIENINDRIKTLYIICKRF